MARRLPLRLEGAIVVRVGHAESDGQTDLRAGLNFIPMNTETIPQVLQVLPAVAPWAYPEMEADFRLKAPIWREVSEDFREQALNVLPPIYGQGGFMVSEPFTHTSRGAVYATFAHVGERYFARYLHRVDLNSGIAELRALLAK